MKDVQRLVTWLLQLCIWNNNKSGMIPMERTRNVKRLSGDG